MGVKVGVSVDVLEGVLFCELLDDCEPDAVGVEACDVDGEIVQDAVSDALEVLSCDPVSA